MRWVELPGAGPARVYVAGLGAMAAAYYPAVALHPALAGHRSLLPDLLGHGLSDRPDDFGYTMVEQADALATLLRAADVRGAEVVAHSMGGSVAIELAARHPELVSRLVVVEPNLGPTPRPRIEGRTEAQFVAAFPAALAAAGEDWAATMRLADPAALYRSERALGELPDLRPVLAGLGVPCALVEGALSEPEREPGVPVLTVPDAGHAVMLDNPDGFATAVAAALRPAPPA